MFNRHITQIFIIGLLAASVNGCATTRTVGIPAAVVDELVLNDICQEYGIQLLWDSVTQVVTINDGDKSINAMIGSDVVIVERQKVIVSWPLRYENGKVMVPHDFVGAIELLRERKVHVDSARVSKVKVIVIDAGHGGKDPGAIGHSGMYEKVVALDIAKKLERALKQKGFNVVMTRETDKFISLAKRTQIASQSKADLFISIHANSHSRRSVHGMEVYAAKQLDLKDLKEDQRRKNHKILFKTLNMKQGDRGLERILGDMLYIHKQGESKVLAKKVVEKTSRSIKARNLGQKDSKFFVLRNTLVPAILVEIGFISNPREERYLKQSAYQEKIVRGIAVSIEDYLGGR